MTVSVSCQSDDKLKSEEGEVMPGPGDGYKQGYWVVIRANDGVVG